MSSSKLFQSLHAWFEPLVTRWIDLADLRAIGRIDKAVELDEVSIHASTLTTFCVAHRVGSCNRFVLQFN